MTKRGKMRGTNTARSGEFSGGTERLAGQEMLAAGTSKICGKAHTNRYDNRLTEYEAAGDRRSHGACAYARRGDASGETGPAQVAGGCLLGTPRSILTPIMKASHGSAGVGV